MPRAAPRIDRLAREIGWSQRRLAAGFIRHAGHPTRTILRLARFQRLIARIDEGGGDHRTGGRWMPATSTSRIWSMATPFG